MKLLIDGRIAEADEIKCLMKTPEGAQRIEVLIKATVVAFAIDNIAAFMTSELKVLNRPLSNEEANDICNVLWSCLYQRSSGELDEYVEQVAAKLAKDGLVQAVANC